MYARVAYQVEHERPDGLSTVSVTTKPKRVVQGQFLLDSSKSGLAQRPNRYRHKMLVLREYT